MLKWLIGAVVLYCGFVALLYVAQRSLQYFPERRRTDPRAVGLPEAEEAVLDTADGERVIVWHVPPREGRPAFLYFHGNGGSLRWRDERFRALIADGSGLLALSYRGYGGSSGRPTETGLVEDAARPMRSPSRAIPRSASFYGVNRSALHWRLRWQRKNQSAALCLAPFTSAADVGAQHYWFVPLRLFMKDQFRSDLRAGKVTAPVLVVHGENDTVVPITLGERLCGLIQAPKRLVRVAGAGHNDLGAHAVAARNNSSPSNDFSSRGQHRASGRLCDRWTSTRKARKLGPRISRACLASAFRISQPSRWSPQSGASQYKVCIS